MFAINETVEELKIRYNETFIKYKGNIYYVEKITDGKIFYLHRWDNSEEKREVIKVGWVNLKKSIDEEVPGSKYIFVSKQAVWMGRTANRQWRRGYKASEYIPYTISSEEDFIAANRELVVNKSSAEVVSKMYEEKYFNVVDATEKLTKGEALSMPVSEKFALAVKAFRRSLALYYKTSLVGRWSVRENQFVLAPNKIFLRELLMAETGYDVRVGEEK